MTDDAVSADRALRGWYYALGALDERNKHFQHKVPVLDTADRFSAWVRRQDPRHSIHALWEEWS